MHFEEQGAVMLTVCVCVSYLGPVEALHGGLRLEVFLGPEAVRQRIVGGGAQSAPKP